MGSVYASGVRRWGRSAASAGVASLLTVAPVPGTSQTPQPALARVRAMATGMRNPKAGVYPLESYPGSLVYLPPQCAGARRCPLVVFNFGDPAEGKQWVPAVVNTYGVIAMVPNRFLRPRYVPELNGVVGQTDKHDFDAAIRETLQRFAIEPDKLALLGRCGTSGEGVSPDGIDFAVFSRFAFVSGPVLPNLGGAAGAARAGLPKTTEFFVQNGLLEGLGTWRSVRTLRQAGYLVKHATSLRGHENVQEDYLFWVRWLQESWTTGPAARPALRITDDSLPELTLDALGRLTAFWRRFRLEPDSVRRSGRLAQLREVSIPVAADSVSVMLVDMRALAARFPSVRTALKAVGLTATQHDAYRVALISARAAQDARGAAGSIVPGSVQAKNFAFVEAHPDELDALEATGMWRMP